MIELKEFDLSMKEALQKQANNENIGKNLAEGFPFPYTDEHAKSFIQLKMKGRNESLAIFYNNKFAGVIGLFPPKDDAYTGIGYWLGEEFWGKGIMTMAIQQFIAYTNKTFAYTKFKASVIEYNTGSIKVLEKNGFKFWKKENKKCNSMQEKGGLVILKYELDDKLKT